MLWIILFAPLVGAVINGLVLRKAKPLVSHLIAITAMAVAFGATITLFLSFMKTGGVATVVEGMPWIQAGGFFAPFNFIVDRLSCFMLLIITGIGLLIHIYAGGYMHEEKSTARFFSYLNLFVFMMLMLVLGDNLLVMFVGWEGVGLCSYLLIGYWFDSDANAAAGMKAFIVNRIGDIGFLLGIFMVWVYFGTVSFTELKGLAMAEAGLNSAQMSMITWITLAFFLGVCGKSAQIPLYIWLPDAMAGPTPVSALIHAATMVTAGVYLMTRLNFFFYLAPFTQDVVAITGAVTALFAATIAITQTDIKKVLAYSTVSQLGFMVLACGVGAHEAGVFHLLTHACFKALLFLGAGSVIVAMHHEQNMLVMGGLRKYLPITHFVMLIGVLAIIGFPGLSGFFSKDEILWRAFNYPGIGKIVWGIAATAAICTSFYMVRLLCLTFYGPNRSDSHTREHLHETPWHMWAPLLVLAALSAGIGYIGIPPVFGVDNIFAHYFHDVIAIPPVAKEHWAFLEAHHSHEQEWLVMGVSVVGMILGSGFALVMYARGPSRLSDRLKAALPRTHALLTDKYRIDELYNHIFVQPLKDLSAFLFNVFDVVIVDGIVNSVGQICVMIGGLTSFRMTGNVHRHAMIFMLGLICLLVTLL